MKEVNGLDRNYKKVQKLQKVQKVKKVQKIKVSTESKEITK